MRWLDYIYPPRCPFCGKINHTGYPCESCLEAAEEFTDLICKRCGAPPEYCKCTNRLYGFTRHLSCFSYKAGPRQLLLSFKERNKPQLAVFMARRMAHHITARYKMQFDGIAYVPQTRRSDLRRGYCPARLLAEQLGEQLNLPVVSALVRVKGKQQKYLSGNARWANARRSFKALPSADVYGRVLLIDDLFTTGATLNACAEHLKEAGAKEVYGVTFCIALKKS